MLLQALIDLKNYRAISLKIEKIENGDEDAETGEDLEELQFDAAAASDKFWHSVGSNGLFSFFVLLTQMRGAQEAYWAACKKGAATAQRETLLSKAKRLETQLDKELKHYTNPPMF